MGKPASAHAPAGLSFTKSLSERAQNADATPGPAPCSRVTPGVPSAGTPNIFQITLENKHRWPGHQSSATADRSRDLLMETASLGRVSVRDTSRARSALALSSRDDWCPADRCFIGADTAARWANSATMFRWLAPPPPGAFILSDQSLASAPPRDASLPHGSQPPRWRNSPTPPVRRPTKAARATRVRSPAGCLFLWIHVSLSRNHAPYPNAIRRLLPAL
jgi:hypothetical protein